MQSYYCMPLIVKECKPSVTLASDDVADKLEPKECDSPNHGVQGQKIGDNHEKSRIRS